MAKTTNARDPVKEKVRVRARAMVRGHLTQIGRKGTMFNKFPRYSKGKSNGQDKGGGGEGVHFQISLFHWLWWKLNNE